jgi:hypothetical protein
MQPEGWHRGRKPLLGLVGLLAAADMGLTLAGQPAAYWAGDRAAGVEANPLAAPFLARGPLAFAGMTAGWVGLVAGLVLGLRHPLADRGAGWVGAGHAFGSAAWLARGPGWAAAVAFLVVAARLLRAFWPGAASAEGDDGKGPPGRNGASG